MNDNFEGYPLPPEKNWTNIPNAFFDRIPKLTAFEVTVMAVIFRETYGGTKQATLSLKTLREKTGLRQETLLVAVGGYTPKGNDQDERRAVKYGHGLVDKGDIEKVVTAAGTHYRVRIRTSQSESALPTWCGSELSTQCGSEPPSENPSPYKVPPSLLQVPKTSTTTKTTTAPAKAVAVSGEKVETPTRRLTKYLDTLIKREHGAKAGVNSDWGGVERNLKTFLKTYSEADVHEAIRLAFCDDREWVRDSRTSALAVIKTTTFNRFLCMATDRQPEEPEPEQPIQYENPEDSPYTPEGIAKQMERIKAQEEAISGS